MMSKPEARNQSPTQVALYPFPLVFAEEKLPVKVNPYMQEDAARLAAMLGVEAGFVVAHRTPSWTIIR
jgi:hypothetical protein